MLKCYREFKTPFMQRDLMIKTDITLVIVLIASLLLLPVITAVIVTVAATLAFLIAYIILHRRALRHMMDCGDE